MKELFGEDIFDKIESADAVCIPTNCSRFKDSEGLYINPMGALAGAFANRWNEIPSLYSYMLKACGNVPCIIGYLYKEDDLASDESFIRYVPDNDEVYVTAVVAFPTMYEIGVPASLDLVERSAQLLVEMADRKGWKNIYVPAVGCGVGGLSYQNQVKPLLEKYFDDRFWVMNK